jgi:hypothetical protein
LAKPSTSEIVSQLHQDYYYDVRYEDSNGAVTKVYERVTSSIHESAFLSKLTDFGFEIARTDSTATELRGNQSSEWIETLVEGKNPGQWTGKHVNLAAAGMSEWFGGFSRPNTSPGYWSSDLRSQAKEALEYAQRLVYSTRLVDDTAFMAEVKEASFLSHMVNLGGSYAALNPSKVESPTAGFLHTMWTTPNQNSNWNYAAKQMVEYIRPTVDSKEILAGAKWRLSKLKNLEGSLLEKIRNSSEELEEIIYAARTNEFSNQRSAYSTNMRPPSGQSNSLAIIDISKFIEIVKDVESTYNKDTTEEIITRIRNMYYPSSDPAFLTLLPTAPAFEGDAGLLRTVRGRASWLEDMGIFNAGRIPSASFNLLDAQADENYDPNSPGLGVPPGDNPSPYIRLKNGQKIDLGHVLLTLDALLHPQTTPIYASSGVYSIEPASWIADLSIGDVWATYHNDNKNNNDVKRRHWPKAPKLKLSSNPTQNELDAYFKASASTQDLLGDVDGFGIFYNICNGNKLSDAFQNYYVDYASQIGGLDERWAMFLDFHTGGVVQDSTDLLRASDTSSGLILATRELVVNTQSSPSIEFGSTLKLADREKMIEQIVGRMDIFDDLFTYQDQKLRLGVKILTGEKIPKYDAKFTREMASRFVDYLIDSARREGRLSVRVGGSPYRLKILEYRRAQFQKLIK